MVMARHLNVVHHQYELGTSQASGRGRSIHLTPQQQAIFKAVRSCYPDTLDTELLLERLHWITRGTLKVQVHWMRRKGVPIVGIRGGRHNGGYRLTEKVSLPTSSCHNFRS